MIQGQYPIISHGLGKLTPDVWRRLMDMLREYEQKNRDERSRIESAISAVRPFLAKIRKAKCIAANRYEYSWIQVGLQDDNTIALVANGKSSTGDEGEWDYAAINLIEIANTSTRASAGVNMAATEYPLGYELQLMGGGSGAVDDEITPDADCIVLLFTIAGRSIESGGDNTRRYVFSNVNEHDGNCGTAVLTLSDPSTEPDDTPDTGYIWLEADGMHWKDEDGNEWTVDDTPV